MYLSRSWPGKFHFVPYFYFAEPYPPGVVVARANTVVPEDEFVDAAKSLRTVDVESVKTHYDTYDTVSDMTALDVMQSMKLSQADLESMSIDEVRAVANVLDIPNRGVITEKAELIGEVLRRV